MSASIRFPTRHLYTRWAARQVNGISTHASTASYTTSTDVGPEISPVNSTKLKGGGNAQPREIKATIPRRTTAESDDELRRILEENSGEGGACGVETEDGKPATMKKAVRNNMFRYI